MSMKNETSVINRKALVMDPSPLQARWMAGWLRAEFGCEVVAVCPNPPPNSAEWRVEAPDIAVVEPWTGMAMLDPSCLLSGARNVLLFTACPYPTMCPYMKGPFRGLLSKHCTSDELHTAVERVLEGGSYIQPSLAEALARSALNGDVRRSAGLTRRQREVLQCLGLGMSLTETGDCLCISTKTVEYHRRNLFRLLGVSSDAALTRLAIQCRIVPLWDEEE